MNLLPHEREIQDYIKTIDKLKANRDSTLFDSEIRNLEDKLARLKEKVYSELSPWQRIQICRHPGRPQSSDYIAKMFDRLLELSGDRLFGDDHAIIGGIGCIGPMKCAVIAQEKGKDTESRIFRNFGMVSPEGFRKSLRIMRLAEKFHLPVVALIDTPGAQPILEAEERGQAFAIAENLRDMAALKTPIIVIVIGEGCSGGALGIGVGDVVAMLEHSYYSVISPESCASILWKDPARKEEAAEAMKLNAENLLALDVIDTVIKEPLGGAHQDPEAMIQAVRQYILEQWKLFKDLNTRILLERRYAKFRRMGAFQQRTSSPS